MPPLVHRTLPRGRYGRARLDPAVPLFVLRRIPAGVDGKGDPIVLEPGSSFDAGSVTKMRLGSLFRSRFIGHEPPRSLRQAPAKPDVVVAPPEPEPTPAPPPPAPAKVDPSPALAAAPPAPAPVAAPATPEPPPPVAQVAAEPSRPAVKASTVVAPRQSLVTPKPPGPRRPGA